MIVKITWKAFGNQPQRDRFVSSVTFRTTGFNGQNINEIADTNILNAIYRDTNCYSGLFWNKIEPLLAPNRTHTALSVGDEIELTNEDTNIVSRYVCAPIGWRCVEDYLTSTVTPSDREYGFASTN